jgi:hypothetical protein
MSTTSPSSASDLAEEELHEPPDYDPYYSGMVSFVFHFCLFLILPFLSAMVRSEDRLPPAVDVVQVIDASSSGSDSFDDLPMGLETQADNAANDMPAELEPTAALDKNIPKDAPTELEFDPNADSQQVADALAAARRAAAAASAAATGQLDENLGGTSGANGSGGSGRAGRAARWVLRFNTRTPRDYLGQLGGLGADIAFPDRGDQYRYYTNLAATPQSSFKSLDNEGRIYWIDQDTYHEVARQLGVSAPMMIAFLPLALEEKMSKLEMARARERGVSREEDIRQTVFECVRRGGGFDVIVVDQTLFGG